MAIKKQTKGKDLALKMAAAVGGGAALSFAFSLALCAVALRLGNALSLSVWVAVICVLAGAFTAALLGIKLCGKPLFGLYTGLIFTALLFLLSLVVGEEKAYPLHLFGAAVLGTVTAFLAFGQSRPSAKKKLKRYLNR